MRKLLLSAVLGLASLGFTLAAPTQAQAPADGGTAQTVAYRGWRGGWGGWNRGYYRGYYRPYWGGYNRGWYGRGYYGGYYPYSSYYYGGYSPYGAGFSFWW
jgi:hypothetical protein